MVAWQGERYRTISGSQAIVQWSCPPWVVTPHSLTPTVLTVPAAAALAVGQGGVQGTWQGWGLVTAGRKIVG